jgi:GNAT superfamily N-acetyltransferase
VSGWTLEPVRYDHPEVVLLVEAVQAEYVRRYGTGDDTVLTPADFDSGRGVFLLGRLDGVPVAMGGWRARDAEQGEPGLADGDAELKRMHVVGAAQRRGFARLLLAALEASAAVAGRRRVVLETGTEQPEAIALYLSSGYAPTEKFGLYRFEASSRCLAKNLGEPPSG